MPESNRVLASVDRRSLVDKVHSSLTEMILFGELEDGQKVSIDLMARSLGVSATPVREALARLASDGVVQTTPHRGYVVTAAWETRSFDQMHEARMVIEPYAARVAARQVRERTDSGLAAKLEQYLGRMIAVSSDTEGGDPRMGQWPNWARLDLRFHQTIMDACDNPLLADPSRTWSDCARRLAFRFAT